jgi:hypothetical protein
MPEATLPRAIELCAKVLTENNELDEKPNTAASSLGKQINNCGKKSSFMVHIPGKSDQLHIIKAK